MIKATDCRHQQNPPAFASKKLISKHAHHYLNVQIIQPNMELNPGHDGFASARRVKPPAHMHISITTESKITKHIFTVQRILRQSEVHKQCTVSDV